MYATSGMGSPHVWHIADWEETGSTPPDEQETESKAADQAGEGISGAHGGYMANEAHTCQKDWPPIDPIQSPAQGRIIPKEVRLREYCLE